MSGSGWDEDYRPIRARSLEDLREDDGHLVYLCSPLEQAVLQRLHEDLVWMLPGLDLAPHLYAKGLITPYEYEQFRTKTTLTEKNEHLLMSLSRRPAGVLESLLSCLDDNDSIPGVKEIANILRKKQKDVELEISHAGSVAPLPTEAQKIQASPGPMVPFVVFEYLRDENKLLKTKNEALRNESEMLKAKLKCFKRRVRRKLKEAIELSDDEGTGYESHYHSRQVEKVKPWTMLPLRKSKHAAFDYDTCSSASSMSSAHTPNFSDEDRVPTPPRDTVQQPHSNQSGRNLEWYYSMQNLSPAQKRHDVPTQQNSSMLVDEPDIGNQEPLNPPVHAQSDDGGGGSILENFPLLGSYFKSDKQTTSKSAKDSVDQLQTESLRTSSSHCLIDSSITSQRVTTPGELSQMKPTSQQMPGQKKTAVDKSTVQKSRKQPEPNSESGAQLPEKPQPPPKSEAVKSKIAQSKAGGQTSQTSSSNGKTRSWTQLKYAQLNSPL